MLLNRTVNKKILESIVHETFSTFGSVTSSSLLDSLKLLGFYYATNAGISISIEDLKTPDIKKDYIQIANDETNLISQRWKQGFVSDTERFQTIIDSWNIATESLKNRIIEYYQKFDPANNLYIMAFSGARGNMSQVRQLVGMRGLMSDQEGKIIDLPIQANFREGLSSIDYIISSYGARKGIVDTALKTADSGYLTRRLIYIAQDLIIREIDCQSKGGVLLFLNKKTTSTNFVGRVLLSYGKFRPPYKNFYHCQLVLNDRMVDALRPMSPVLLKVRSSLTCQSNGSICQKCYGWDLATEKLISLGEAVGIIAAQSIGEPGTQLTMRTFHTGGIFTSESVKQIAAPLSGKLIFPKNLKTLRYRTNQGKIVLKLQQEACIPIITWQGFLTEVSLSIGSYLYFNKSGFVKKGQLLAEYSNTSFLPGTRRLKPIYTLIAGEIKLAGAPILRKVLQNQMVQANSVLWIASGKIFPLPKEIGVKFGTSLNKKKSFASLKIVSPYLGQIQIINNTLIIQTKEKKIHLNIQSLTKRVINCWVKIILQVKNYQYVDPHTILGYVEFYPNYEGLVYSIKKKPSKYTDSYFFITEDDIWKINSDQVNDFSFFKDRKTVIRKGDNLNTNSIFDNSGFFLKHDGFRMLFQKATPVFLSRGTILNYKKGDFVLEKKTLATLVNYIQQTQDIVQGLPKIDELIEARHPKIAANLAERPGIFIRSYSRSAVTIKDRVTRARNQNPQRMPVLAFRSKFFENLVQFWQPSKTGRKKPKQFQNLVKTTRNKNIISIVHSLDLSENIFVLNDQLFKGHVLPSSFQIPKWKKQSTKELRKKIPLQNGFNCNLLFDGKQKFSRWTWIYDLLPDLKEDILEKKIEIKEKIVEKKKSRKIHERKKIIPIIYRKNNLGLHICKELKNLTSLYTNESDDYLLEVDKNWYVFFERLIPIQEYKLPLTANVNFDAGTFIDLGEPITEGSIDIHELLEIFFKYHCYLDGLSYGTIRSLQKFQLLLVNSIQAIYQSQGVNISSKHIEIIVRQMTGKVIITESGDTPLLPGEIIKLSLINEIVKALTVETKDQFLSRSPLYEPIIMSATLVSLSKDGFLSPAGFQETKKILTRSALEGTSDWLQNLKECIIIGRLIPAGSSFLNYKNYLDNIYLFKD